MSKPAKKYNRYIPELVKQKLDELEYDRKENLICIIDIIYRKHIYYKSEAQKRYGYSPIALIAFNSLLGRAAYVQQDIQFLIDQGIIKKHNYYDYSTGKCKEYKIAYEYLSKKVPVEIQSTSINKRIKKERDRYKRLKVKNLDFAKTDYYKTFKIDYNGAIKFLEDRAFDEIKTLCKEISFSITKEDIYELLRCGKRQEGIKRGLAFKDTNGEFYSIMHRYMLYTMQINCINDGYLYFKRNRTNNRLDSNLTSLPKFLRPFIVCESELFSIDIKSSQPFFLYTMIKDNQTIDPIELNLYKNLVTDSGDKENGFYEFLMDKHNKANRGNILNRKQMKEMVCRIFYSKIPSYKPAKDFFKTYFPTINNFINEQKVDNHKEFAIKLQNIESELVLDVVMPLLEKENITPFTIHDNFICRDTEVNTIVDLMKNKTMELYGCSPCLHVDSITNEDDDDISIEEELELFGEILPF